MKKILFALAIVFFSASLYAQFPAAGMGGGAQRQAPSIGRVYGKLVDSTGKGVSDASVLLLQSRDLDLSASGVKPVRSAQKLRVG